ncbi:unnamed protein product [Prunus armeniaca]
MELFEIEDLPKKLLREEAGRAFRLQASVSANHSQLQWACGCASSEPSMPAKRRRRLMKMARPGLPRLASLSKLMRIW